MKALVLILALISASAFAETKQEQVERCTGYAEMSGAVMAAVQRGVPMVELLKAVKYDERIVIIAKEAYKVNVYQTKAYQERAVSKFSNSVMMACLSAPKLN